LSGLQKLFLLKWTNFKGILMKKIITAVTASCFLLTACVHPSQKNYGESDVGHNAVILYGKVISEREVDITGQNSGVGAGAGVVGGGLAGSMIGHGNGSLGGLLVGAVVGGVAGAAAEQAIKDRKGIEYIIKFYASGQTQSIVQNIAKTDEPIAKGQCVMVQMSGTYQRVLPAEQDAEECYVAPVKKKKKHAKEDSEE